MAFFSEVQEFADELRGIFRLHPDGKPPRALLKDTPPGGTERNWVLGFCWCLLEFVDVDFESEISLQLPH